MSDRESPATTTLDVTIDRAAGTPLYLQLSAAIEAAIHDGTLPVGARLENEVGLAQRLQLSRPTVRQGIQELVDKGMLVRKRGVGTQVVQAPVSRPVALTSLYDDLASSGKTPSTTVLEYRIGASSAEVAGHLQREVGSQVLEITRLRKVDGEPLAVMRNAIPEPFAPGRDELVETGLYEALRRRGIRSAVAHERIGAISADEEIAELLGEPVGAALLTMERTSYANDGTVIEHGRHVYRATRYSFEVTLVD